MKRFLLLFVATFIVLSIYAVPAYRKPFTVKQSDGTELTLLLAGDEALHYFTTIDGMPLVKEADGNFYYATFDSGSFVSTKCLAHNSAVRSAAEREVLSSIDFSAMHCRKVYR